MVVPPGRDTATLEQLIGSTPLVVLETITQGLDRIVWVKLESRNLGGSVKDRPARYMVEQAERNGELAPGGRIIEATSGNTGIALAQIGVLKGYPVVIVMPEGVSQERVYHLKALGAEVELTPAREGMAGAIRRAEAILSEQPGSFMPRQFDNPANPTLLLLFKHGAHPAEPSIRRIFGQARRSASFLSCSTISSFSQVKSSSFRPK